ncbi:MAG: hypothetical protein EXS23_00275 [Pedosphaera sp.]|nr:hypothetical protein [Pedosphaera sp.]
MRTTARFLAILVVIFTLALPTKAWTPIPSLTFYGSLTDEFGWPYQSDVSVDIYAQGVKILSREITPAIGVDYNYLIRVPYGTPGGREYSPDVVIMGETVTVKIVDLKTSVTLITTNFVCNLPAGTVVNFNAWAGQDSLEDGLPDDLRHWIWSALGRNEAFKVHNYRSSDDSDGDGVNNLDEYLGGTDPANAEDMLKIFVARTPNPDVVQLTFFSVPGKVYQVSVGVVTSEGAFWKPTRFASAPGGLATELETLGTGQYLSLTVPIDQGSNLLRIAVPVRRGFKVLP